MGWWFGRILTFEVVADGGSADVGSILNEVSDRAIALEGGNPVAGFAAYGRSQRVAAQSLIDAMAVTLYDDGERLRAARNDAAVELTQADLGHSPNDRQRPYEREQTPACSLPNSLSLTFYDPALDYQTGEARATAAGGGSEENLPVPIVLDEAVARRLADEILGRRWRDRDRLKLHLPTRLLGLEPGRELLLPMTPQRWRVESVVLDGFTVVAELRPAARTPPVITSAAMVRTTALAKVQKASGWEPQLATFEIPALPQFGWEQGMVTVLAAATRQGRGGTLELSAGGAQLIHAVPRRKPVLGRASTLLAAGESAVIDRQSRVRVRLADPEGWLTSCDDEALVAGSNLAVLGRELFQFGKAEPIDAGQFELSHLVRGRGGTEWTMGSHAEDEDFLLLDPTATIAFRLPLSSRGAAMATIYRDPTGATLASSSGFVSGESLRGPAPVQFRATAGDDGSVRITWARRSRLGWAWTDEVDVPIGEDGEQYQVRVSSSSVALERVVTRTELRLSPKELQQFGGVTCEVSIRQIGDFAASYPLLGILPERRR